MLNLNSRGRIKIFTSEKEITSENVLSVLQRAVAIHNLNAADIQALLDYEKGDQPLARLKMFYPEIDIEVSDNAANYVTSFWEGFFWGEPAFLVQRGHKEAHGTDPEADGYAIAELNEMLVNGADVGYLDQKLAHFVEVSGIGHQMVDFKGDVDAEEKDLLFNLYTLDSRNAFVVYYNGVGERPVMGVSFRRNTSLDTGITVVDGMASLSGNAYTVVTENSFYEIVDGEIVEEAVNPFGKVTIVEYERAVDRMGVFERNISEMDSLNTMVSDLSDDIAQRVQEIWWGNDVAFPVDKNTGKPLPPRDGQWVLTSTNGGAKNPAIKPLSSSLDANATLKNISYRWSRILQKCKVPLTMDSEGGGSTGTAMNMSSGWSAAEVDALKRERMIGKGKREVVNLILSAIRMLPENILPADDILRALHRTDIDLHFNRNRNYDLATKANSIGTLLAHGIYGKHALSCADLFPDVEQVWNDSKDTIEKYQASIYERYHDSSYFHGDETVAQQSENKANSDRTMADSSDQTGNSPILDGMKTDSSKAK